MTAEDNARLRFVVGVDCEPSCEIAIGTALQLGARLGGAELHLTNVVDHAHFERKRQLAEGRDVLIEHEERLVTFSKQVIDRTYVPASAMKLVFHVRIGDPVEALTQVALDVDAGLVIVGATLHKRPTERVVGPVPARLASSGRVPVLVARPRNFEGMQPTEKPEPARPGESLHSPRHEMLQWSDRVSAEIEHYTPHISGLI